MDTFKIGVKKARVRQGFQSAKSYFEALLLRDIDFFDCSVVYPLRGNREAKRHCFPYDIYGTTGGMSKI